MRRYAPPCGTQQGRDIGLASNLRPARGGSQTFQTQAVGSGAGQASLAWVDKTMAVRGHTDLHSFVRLCSGEPALP